MQERGNWKLRALDRYMGIPLIVLLGLLKRKHLSPPRIVRSVAILEIAAIGDTLLLASIIHDLKSNFPGVRLVIFVAANNIQAGRMLEEVDSLVLLNIKNPLTSITTIRAQGPFDLWFDFGQWPRINSLLTYGSLANFKIGFKTAGQFRHFIYDCAVEHSRRVHEIENYRSLLKSLNLIVNSEPRLKVSPKQETNTVIVHMFPGGSKPYLKEWPEKNWKTIINFITGLGLQVFLTGISSDKFRAEALRAQCQDSNSVVVLAGSMSLEECSELIQRAKLVISVNTGIMHLAALLQRNLIALNGPTSAKRWGPLNPNSIAIQSDISCSPCLNLGFEYGCNQNLCMQKISSETVIEAISKFLPTSCLSQ